MVIFRLCVIIAERILLGGLVVNGESFSFPWILEASETVGTTVSKCCLGGRLGQQFCPTIKSNKYLFIDN